MSDLEDLKQRIRSRLSVESVSQSTLMREIGGSRGRMSCAVEELLASGEVRRAGVGSVAKLELAAPVYQDDDGAAPTAPANDRIRLVEELLEIERLLSELPARRLQILEALK